MLGKKTPTKQKRLKVLLVDVQLKPRKGTISILFVSSLSSSCLFGAS